MQPGTLRRRIAAQKLVTARLPNGEQIESWQTVITRWGSMKYRSGREIPAAGLQVVGEAYWEFILRYESSLSAMDIKWRLEVGGRTFRIRAVENVNDLNQLFKINAVEDV